MENVNQNQAENTLENAVLLGGEGQGVLPSELQKSAETDARVVTSETPAGAAGEDQGAQHSELQESVEAGDKDVTSETLEGAAGEGQESEAEFRIIDEGGQLSLFGFDAITSSNTEEKKDSPDSCGADAKKTEAGKKNNRGTGRTKPSVQVAPPKPELEHVKLGEGWKIHYAATVFEVDILFEDELNSGVENVTLEEIRMKLVVEEDAAELTPSGTKWHYDVEQKKLFPDDWGQDKGAC
jgi:hypothetical protein